MKKLTFTFIFLMILLACTRYETTGTIEIGSQWKFKTGNDLAWAATDFDDSSWDTILVTDWWENQGVKDHDGFAWYRTKIRIPISLKEASYYKDSLQFLLGKIDDCDQVFLNGSLIGENGRTILKQQQPLQNQPLWSNLAMWQS